MRNAAGGRWGGRLGSWVHGYGAYRLAHELGVTPDAVYHWVAGRRAPAPGTAWELVRRSGGALRLEDVYPQQRGGGRPAGL